MSVPDFVRPHADAILSGIEAAGFIEAKVAYDAHAENFYALAACPCGLGRSRFTVSRYGSNNTFGVPTKWFQRTPSELKAVVTQAALEHIEQDKKEGRWIP